MDMFASGYYHLSEDAKFLSSPMFMFLSVIEFTNMDVDLRMLLSSKVTVPRGHGVRLIRMNTHIQLDRFTTHPMKQLLLATPQGKQAIQEDAMASPGSLLLLLLLGPHRCSRLSEWSEWLRKVSRGTCFLVCEAIVGGGGLVAIDFVDRVRVMVTLKL